MALRSDRCRPLLFPPALSVVNSELTRAVMAVFMATITAVRVTLTGPQSALGMGVHGH